MPGRRRAIGKQVGDEGLGAETSRPPPVLINGRAGELVREITSAPLKTSPGG
jgi:hypothetical protein